MKQREDAKHERRNRIQAQSSAIHAALRTADIHRVWFSEPAAADRACEIHRVVAVSLSVDRRGNRMGDVSVLALKERYLRAVGSVQSFSHICRDIDPGMRGSPSGELNATTARPRPQQKWEKFWTLSTVFFLTYHLGFPCFAVSTRS